MSFTVRLYSEFEVEQRGLLQGMVVGIRESQNSKLGESPINRDGAISATAAAFNAETFGTPQEYLATIKSNFSKLSHDHSSITLADLLVDARDQSLSPKTREAAAISAKHFNELQAMKDEGDASPEKNTLTVDDLNFLADMMNHKTIHRGLSAAVSDLKEGAMWSGLGLGFGMGSTAILDAGTVTLLTGAAAASAGALGIGAIGIGGYFAYRAATEIHHYSRLADQDKIQINRWLR